MVRSVETRGIGEVVVMDLTAMEARTRGRASGVTSSVADAASTGLAKRRRTDVGDESLKLWSNNSTCTQLKDSTGGRNSASPPSVPATVTESFLYLSTSSEDQASVSSCCSSYGSSEVVKDKFGFADLEEFGEADSSTSRLSIKRREMTTSSSEVGGEEVDGLNSSVVKAAEANPPEGSENEFQSSVDTELEGLPEKPETKMPSDFEIEEFFTAAEAKSLLDLELSKNKYNFDFVKEEPLKGRFEWHNISLE